MNKNILVTGASRGLGKEISLSLAKRDDTESIVIVARNKTKLEETKKEISKINRSVHVEVIDGDLSNRSEINKLIQKLKDIEINFNVIINNAGTGIIAPLENINDEEIEKMFFVNIIAPVLLIRSFLPSLRKNHCGRIINISSISVFKPNSLLIPYVVSKSALESLSECITVAEIKNGITCNTIVPGLMLTEMGKESIKKSFPDYNERTANEIENKIAKNLPSGKFTDLSEITNIIDFLLNDSSHNISGEFFRVASGII